jgi:hypothetical protein
MRGLLIIGLGIAAVLLFQAKQEAEEIAKQRRAVIDLQARQLTDANNATNNLRDELQRVQQVSDTPTTPITDTIKWLSWKDGKLEAQRSGLPSLLHFTRGSSCRPCENLRQNIFTDQQVVEASKQFVCVEFMLADKASDDTEENKAALKAFGIDRDGDGIPQDVFLAPKWSSKSWIVLGGKMPDDAKGYLNYLNQWASFLKDK